MVPHRFTSALALMLAPVCLPAAGCMQTVYLSNLDAGTGQDGFPFGGGDHPGFGQCGQVYFTPHTPDVILMVDRSTAMQVPFGNSSTRFVAAQTTLKGLVPANPAVHFGYGQFPSPNGCGQGPGSSDGCCAGDIYRPSSNSLMAFDRFIQGCDRAPCVSTQRPIGDALMHCRIAYDQLDQNVKYVLLVIGGDPNCTNDATTACSDAQGEAAKLSNAGIPTFVVAVGDELASDDCLNNLAVAGNRPLGGSQSYYLATTPSDLTSALSNIIHKMARDACTFDLGFNSGGTDKLMVFFHNNPVNHDSGNGWDFDNGNMFRITLYGDACDSFINSGADPQSIVIESGRGC